MAALLLATICSMANQILTSAIHISTHLLGGAAVLFPFLPHAPHSPP